MPRSNNDLTSYGLFFKTDKAYWHQYTDAYYRYFSKIRYNKNNILEIGIGSDNAPSINMLSRFFDNSTIFAVDTIPSFVSNANLVNNVNAFICDSSNKYRLLTTFNKIQFDLIIDDGSHIASHQQNAFECLFPMLKNNGIFICEDVHPSGSIHNNLMISYFNNHHLKSQYKSIEIVHRKAKALRCYDCKKLNTENVGMCSCGISLLPSNDDSISIIIVKNDSTC